MTTHRHKVHTQLSQTSVKIFAANDRMNQLLIENLDPAAWRAKPSGKTRTIAAIFTHMHNVRAKWVRLTAPHLKVPTQLNRAHCTPQQARAGLAESAARCAEMLADALGGSEKRVKGFRRDGLAPSWPVGVEMLCYMLAHEAHHRGQVCMLAHQLGFPLPYKASDGIWIGKSCGGSAVRFAAPASILKKSLEGAAPARVTKVAVAAPDRVYVKRGALAMTLAQTSLRQIAADHPAVLSIFDRFQIDLCHNAGQSLAEACAALQLSTEQLEEKISGLASFAKVAAGLGNSTLTRLIQHIVRVHHRRVRRDLPALAEMAARLEENHAEEQLEHVPLARLVSRLHLIMFNHIGREEQILFPFIALMEDEPRLNYPAEHAAFRALRAPISRLIQEHDTAGEILEELRQRTSDFTPTRTACGAKRALFASLKAIDAETREHIRLENDLLFPRAIALESKLASELAQKLCAASLS